MGGEKYPYQKQWEDYRRKSKEAWLTFYIAGPGLFLTFISFKYINENTAFIWFRLVFILLLVVMGNWIINRAVYWSCPRCGATFKNKMLFASIIVKDCGGCGLKKYEGSSFQTY